MVVSIPGEMTVTMGQRVRKAVLDATAGGGVSGVVIAGLANEYLSYFTTPEEYQQQHYEGGSTLYGRYSSNLLMATAADLGHRLVSGQPAPFPYAYDPTHGVSPDAPPFPTGATSAVANGQPQATPRLGHAAFKWTGGLRALDRPLEAPFVTVRRRAGDRWERVTDDLGLQILWSVDDQGNYQATWEVPRDAAPGTYEFLITANHYQLESSPFSVAATGALTIKQLPSSAGTARLELDYPAAVANQDITYRPPTADGGTLNVSVGGHTLTVNGQNGTFAVPAPSGTPVTVQAGGARDAYGNLNGNTLSFTA
jgi:neutral ceramidase